MKQEFKQLALTVALALLMGCAFTTQAQIADSLLIINNRAIAGIRIGMKMSKVPKSIPGLYDKYMEDYGCEYGVTYWCNVSDEDPQLIISDDDENGIIDGIDVQIMGARIADTDITIGKPIAEVISTPGLVKKKIVQEDYEYYDYIYKGIYHIECDTDPDTNMETISGIRWGLR